MPREGTLLCSAFFSMHGCSTCAWDPIDWRPAIQCGACCRPLPVSLLLGAEQAAPQWHHPSPVSRPPIHLSNPREHHKFYCTSQQCTDALLPLQSTTCAHWTGCGRQPAAANTATARSARCGCRRGGSGPSFSRPLTGFRGRTTCTGEAFDVCVLDLAAAAQACCCCLLLVHAVCCWQFKLRCWACLLARHEWPCILSPPPCSSGFSSISVHTCAPHGLSWRCTHPDVKPSSRPASQPLRRPASPLRFLPPLRSSLLPCLVLLAVIHPTAAAAGNGPRSLTTVLTRPRGTCRSQTRCVALACLRTSWSTRPLRSPCPAATAATATAATAPGSLAG